MRIVVYGAGAVGRGLIGRLFCNAGHRVAFVEKQMEVARRLAMNSYYPLNTGAGLEWIGPVASCMPGTEASELAAADVVVCCVRVENMAEVAEAMRKPHGPRATPLPVIVVENTPNAGAQFTSLLSNLDFCCYSGIAECVIPEVDPDVQLLDPALMNGDAAGYLVLPVQLEKVLGDIKGISYSTEFEFDWALKWYCHCALHAVIAYVGLARGFKYIDEIVCDARFSREMNSLNAKIAKRLGRQCRVAGVSRVAARLDIERETMTQAAIRDTCARVARDPARKIQPGERLMDLQVLVGGHPLITEALLQAQRMAAP